MACVCGRLLLCKSRPQTVKNTRRRQVLRAAKQPIVDRLASDYVYYTPYQFAGNAVPNAIDLDGLEPMYVQDAYNPTDYSKPENRAAAFQAVGNLIQMGKVPIYLVGTVALPNVFVPLILSDISGLPVSSSPQAMGGPVTTVESTVVSVEQRAKDIQSAQSTFAQTKTTTAVGTGTTQSGESVTMVSSSNARLSPAQRATLNPNETAISNKTLGVKSGVKIHAEQKITQYAAQNNITVGEVAASRPICPNCAAALNNAGAAPASPLKVIPGTSIPLTPFTKQ